MKTDTFYLNNNGSRWVNFTNGETDSITLLTKAGKSISRKVKLYESFGNHAVAHISYHGKIIRVFADSILED